MRIFCLAARQIESTWADYAHLFEKFDRQYGEISPSQIKAAALDERMQVWGIQDDKRVLGVTVTEIQEIPRGRVCLIRVAVGGAPVAMQRQLLHEIGAWAKAQGCVAVRLIGRSGWLRRFTCFRPTAVVAEWNL